MLLRNMETLYNFRRNFPRMLCGHDFDSSWPSYILMSSVKHDTLTLILYINPTEKSNCKLAIPNLASIFI